MGRWSPAGSEHCQCQVSHSDTELTIWKRSSSLPNLISHWSMILMYRHCWPSLATVVPNPCNKVAPQKNHVRSHKKHVEGFSRSGAVVAESWSREEKMGTENQRDSRVGHSIIQHLPVQFLRAHLGIRGTSMCTS